MKNVRLLLLAMVAVTMSFSSCTNDETDVMPVSDVKITTDMAPTGGFEVEVGKTIKIGYVVSATKSKIASVIVAKAGTIVETITSDVKDGYTGMITFEALEADMGTVSFTITSVDNDKLITIATVLVRVVAAPINLDVVGEVTLGAQGISTLGSFYAVTEDSVLLINAASSNQAIVDMVYYFGTNNKATLCAPDDESVSGTTTSSYDLCKDWTVKNATRFMDSNLDFEMVKTEEDLKMLTPSLLKVTNLEAGKVIVFMTASGEKGIIKIVSIVAEANGSMKMTLKVK